MLSNTPSIYGSIYIIASFIIGVVILFVSSDDDEHETKAN